MPTCPAKSTGRGAFCFHSLPNSLLKISLTVMLAGALEACGQAAAPVTPTPPTPTPTATVTGTPTPVVAAAGPDSLQSFTHSSNRFSISYPANWTAHERDDAVIFVEPGDRAGYSVVFNDTGKAYSQQELNQFLVTFVAQNFAGEGSNFKAIKQQTQADGSIVAQFSTTDPNLGQTISQVKVFQQSATVFVLHFSAIQEQWDASRPGLQALVNSFTPLEPAPAAQAAPTQEPVWELIGPESKEFGFFYASNWEVTTQNENSVSVTEPTTNMTFTASNFNWPAAKNNAKAAKAAALAFIQELSKEYQVQHLPPTEFPLDTAAGATIDFYYLGPDDTPFAGSVITALNKGKMHRIVFTAPAEPVELYDAALQWFNPMYKSFKFLKPEDFTD